MDACHKIEAHFGFPAPNELVKRAEIPGGMYTNMVAQLKQFKSEDLLEKAMELIPEVRLAAGLPPLVTPTSQIGGELCIGHEEGQAEIHDRIQPVREPRQG